MIQSPEPTSVKVYLRDSTTLKRFYEQSVIYLCRSVRGDVLERWRALIGTLGQKVNEHGIGASERQRFFAAISSPVNEQAQVEYFVSIFCHTDSMNVTVNDLQKALDGLPSRARCCSRIIEGMFFVRQKEELYRKGQIGELSTIHIPKIHLHLGRTDHLINGARTKGYDFALSGCNLSEGLYYSFNQPGAGRMSTISSPFSSRVERTPVQSVDQSPTDSCLNGDIDGNSKVRSLSCLISKPASNNSEDMGNNSSYPALSCPTSTSSGVPNLGHCTAFCVPVNSHFQGLKADLSFDFAIEYQEYSTEGIRIGMESTTYVAIREQKLIPKSGFLHGLLRHPCVVDCIRRDAVVGRLWLLAVPSMSALRDQSAHGIL